MADTTAASVVTITHMITVAMAVKDSMEITSGMEVTIFTVPTAFAGFTTAMDFSTTSMTRMSAIPNGFTIAAICHSGRMFALIDHHLDQRAA